MPDVFSKAKRSQVMAQIRSRGNKDTELALAKLLRQKGITGWRRQVKVHIPNHRSPVPSLQSHSSHPRSHFTVRPDFMLRKERVALFVDGCFWHGCPKHANLPVNNRAFWRKKLKANKARDRFVNRVLRKAGWRVLRLWEHALTKHPERCVMRIRKALPL